VRTLKTGQIIGGISFTRGPLAYLLRNRFYVGKARAVGTVEAFNALSRKYRRVGVVETPADGGA
jgi:hypothetical protein